MPYTIQMYSISCTPSTFAVFKRYVRMASPMEMKRVVDLAQPRFLEGTRNEGVLLIHGLASYPGVLDNISAALHGLGYWVSVPRLPGHGTDGADYVSASGHDWLRRAADSMFELAGKCAAVHLLGLSLGGVLALILAGGYEAKSLVLLAPAVTNTNRLILLTPLLRRFLKRLPDEVNYEGQDPEEPDIKYLAEEYWSWQWAGPAAELLKLQRRAKRAASRVKTKTMLIVSKADRAVPMKVKQLLEGRLGSQLARTVILENSEHTLPAGREKERVVAEVISWFSQAAW